MLSLRAILPRARVNALVASGRWNRRAIVPPRLNPSPPILRAGERAQFRCDSNAPLYLECCDVFPCKSLTGQAFAGPNPGASTLNSLLR